MRRVLAVAVCLGFLGCGGSEFTSEREELTYLSSLSNPTPTQWKRKTELTEMAEAKVIQAKRDSIDEADRAKVKQYYADGESHIKRWMAQAAEYEAKSEWKSAWLAYENVCREYPDSSAAKEAKGKSKVCLDEMSKIQ